MKKQKAGKGNHVILCNKVEKNPSEPHSGWRWHENGEYIGIRNQQKGISK